MAATPVKAKPAYVIPLAATEIDFSSKKLGDVASAEIIEEFNKNHRSLKKLKLLDNRITDVGATAIARLLAQNPGIERLSLGRNQIGDDGCVQLARMLSENTNLQRLYLGDNPITDKGATALARVLETKNTTLKELALSRCDLTDTCIPVWCDVIRKNETLQKLKISPAGNVGISSMGARLLLRAVKENDTLKDLWILAYSSRAGSFRPAALVSGLKGRRETVAIMQTEITNQLHRTPQERKKLKEASRQTPHTTSEPLDELSPPGPNSLLAMRVAQSMPVFSRTDIDVAKSTNGAVMMTNGYSHPPAAAAAPAAAAQAKSPTLGSSPPPPHAPVEAPPPLGHSITAAMLSSRGSGPGVVSEEKGGNGHHAKDKSKRHQRTNSDSSAGHRRHPTWAGKEDPSYLDLSHAEKDATGEQAACHHGDLVGEVSHLKQQLAFLETSMQKKDRRADRLKAELTDQRNLTTHLQGELDILRREMARLKEKCDSRGRKIIHLREQAKAAVPHVHVVPPTPPQPKAAP